mmetsp:Transcript_1141/g.3682  ORF Transcript_1141/g.3682 Transcript_1141/m.3682 type:complete len:307 (+) Transcript_1141:82-1002(+)
MQGRFPRRLQSSGWAASSKGEDQSFGLLPEEQAFGCLQDSMCRQELDDSRGLQFGASFSECGPPDDFLNSIVEEGQADESLPSWDAPMDSESLAIFKGIEAVSRGQPFQPVQPQHQRDGSFRRAMSAGPSGFGRGSWVGSFAGAPAASYASFASRASGASFATSAWQSSVASFSSEACGERSDMVMIGRRAQPELLSLTTMMDCPKGPTGEFLSLGSRLHDDAACTPCKFFRSARGCRDGALCKLCHYPHEGETRSAVRRAVRRSGLQKRAQFEANAARLLPEMVKNTFIHVGVGEPTAWRRCLST